MVTLYETPWVRGYSAEKFFGPIRADVHYVGSWEITLELATDWLCEQADSLGANAVVNVERQIDPFSGVATFTGTAARLRELWGT